MQFSKEATLEHLKNELGDPVGDFKAVRPRRFHTPHHACCLLSLLLLQQLVL